ncbi:MAG: hypothetical protein ACI8P0_004454, partial [Planctomycetaceae bacterium]
MVARIASSFRATFLIRQVRTSFRTWLCTSVTLTWLKPFAISLLKQQNDKESIAMRRRMGGWNVDYRMQVLAIKPVQFAFALQFSVAEAASFGPTLAASATT